MFNSIILLIKLISIKLSIEGIKFSIRFLTLISQFFNYAKIILNTYFLSSLEKKFLNLKNNFKNFKSPKKKDFVEKNNKDLIVRDYSTWSNFNFRPILITTDHKSKRCQNTLDNLEKLDLKPDIFVGKTPKDITKFLIKSHILSASKPVQIACLISHLLAIKNALNNFDEDIFLILEDDAILFPNPSLVGLHEAVENKDWEVLQLEHHDAHGIKRFINLYNKGILLHRWHPYGYGSSAYLIRRKFAQRLIYYFFGKEDDMRIDLQRCYEFNEEIVADKIIYDFAQTLVFTFPLSYQDPNLPSLIGYDSRRMEERASATNLVEELWRKYI